MRDEMQPTLDSVMPQSSPLTNQAAVHPSTWEGPNDTANPLDTRRSLPAVPFRRRSRTSMTNEGSDGVTHSPSLCHSTESTQSSNLSSTGSFEQPLPPLIPSLRSPTGQSIGALPAKANDDQRADGETATGLLGDASNAQVLPLALASPTSVGNDEGSTMDAKPSIETLICVVETSSLETAQMCSVLATTASSSTPSSKERPAQVASPSLNTSNSMKEGRRFNSSVTQLPPNNSMHSSNTGMHSSNTGMHSSNIGIASFSPQKESLVPSPLPSLLVPSGGGSAPRFTRGTSGGMSSSVSFLDEVHTVVMPTPNASEPQPFSIDAAASPPLPPPPPQMPAYLPGSSLTTPSAPPGGESRSPLGGSATSLVAVHSSKVESHTTAKYHALVDTADGEEIKRRTSARAKKKMSSYLEMRQERLSSQRLENCSHHHHPEHPSQESEAEGGHVPDLNYLDVAAQQQPVTLYERGKVSSSLMKLAASVKRTSFGPVFESLCVADEDETTAKVKAAAECNLQVHGIESGGSSESLMSHQATPAQGPFLSPSSVSSQLMSRGSSVDGMVHIHSTSFQMDKPHPSPMDGMVITSHSSLSTETNHTTSLMWSSDSYRSIATPPVAVPPLSCPQFVSKRHSGHESATTMSKSPVTSFRTIPMIEETREEVAPVAVRAPTAHPCSPHRSQIHQNVDVPPASITWGNNSAAVANNTRARNPMSPTALKRYFMRQYGQKAAPTACQANFN